MRFLTGTNERGGGARWKSPFLIRDIMDINREARAIDTKLDLKTDDRLMTVTFWFYLGAKHALAIGGLTTCMLSFYHSFSKDLLVLS